MAKAGGMAGGGKGQPGFGKKTKGSAGLAKGGGAKSFGKMASSPACKG
jgi:hypothetical protein